MNRRRRRTVFALESLEGRLALSGAAASVVLTTTALPDTTVSVNIGTVVAVDPTGGPGVGDPTGPGSNDGQLPFIPLSPAPLNPAGPY